MRWDKGKLQERNLYVYGKDDTKIMVYNMRRWPKESGSKDLEKKDLETSH